MKSNLLILVTLGIFSCSKEECVTIENKQEINGNYYFFLEGEIDIHLMSNRCLSRMPSNLEKCPLRISTDIKLVTNIVIDIPFG